MDFSVRQYRKGDEKNIVILLEQVFDGWPHFDLECTSLDHWKWKYLNNPLKMTSIIVGISNDKIIGCDHAIYRNMYIQQKTQLCTYGTDTAIHPEYRRIGVYTKLNKLKNKIRENAPIPVNLSYWTSGNPILIKRGKKRNRPHFIHPSVDFIRINDIDLHLENRETKHAPLKKLYINIQKIRNSFSRNYNRVSLQTDPSLNISNIDSFDIRFNGFFEAIKNNYNFIIEKTQEYLNWRYCDPHGGKFIVKIAEKENAIVGYMVLRINKYNEQYHEGYIVDMLGAPNQGAVLEPLLLDALRFFDESSLNIIHSYAFSNSSDAYLLRKYGFFSARNDQIVFLNPMAYDDNIDILTRSPPEKIHYTYGSSDWI